MRRLWWAAGVALLACVPAVASSGIDEAEALASQAAGLTASDPEQALALARRALEASRDFDPTAFVDPGRKGEVFEDAFLGARARYRAHRSRLYAAAGRALAAQGRHEAATRYLGRAALLAPGAAPVASLALSLAAVGRGWQALDLLLEAPRLDSERLAVAQQVADQLRLPSLQAEIDARRLAGLGLEGVEARRGPIRFPPQTRVSTGARLRLDATQPLLVYVAEASCRTCSADFEELARVTQPLLILPAPGAGERALREILRVYGYDWPFLLGVDAAALRVSGPAVLVLGREGWSNVVVRPPLVRALSAVLEVMARNDVAERLPRTNWNGRDVEPQPPLAPPALLDDGLAPGESDPAVPEFVIAREAFAAGRFAEAAKLFGLLAQDDEGWMLPPEARYNRALCLARQGRGDEARRELLRIGDSRFQDAVDHALESVAAR